MDIDMYIVIIIMKKLLREKVRSQLLKATSNN